MKHSIDDVASVVMDKLKLKEPQTREAAKVLLEYLELFERKHHDYGPGNIARFGELGVLVRAHDKMERLINLQNFDPVVGDESKDDTWQDLMGYALIAQLVRRGKWLQGNRGAPTSALDVSRAAHDQALGHWGGDGCYQPTEGGGNFQHDRCRVDAEGTWVHVC